MRWFNFLENNERKELIKKNVFIGKYSYQCPEIFIWTDRYKVTIGKFCSISDNVRIIVDGNHCVNWISTYPFSRIFDDVKENKHSVGKGDIIIGSDVWIGKDVIILPGVNVGNGAVIGAGSVVTKNVHDYEIFAGNPARSIGFRFDEKQIKSLLEIKWWDWPIEKIKENLDVLQSSDIDRFIKRFMD